MGPVRHHHSASAELANSRLAGEISITLFQKPAAMVSLISQVVRTAVVTTLVTLALPTQALAVPVPPPSLPPGFDSWFGPYDTTLRSMMDPNNPNESLVVFWRDWSAGACGSSCGVSQQGIDCWPYSTWRAIAERTDLSPAEAGPRKVRMLFEKFAWFLWAYHTNQPYSQIRIQGGGLHHLRLSADGSLALASAPEPEWTRRDRRAGGYYDSEDMIGLYAVQLANTAWMVSHGITPWSPSDGSFAVANINTGVGPGGLTYEGLVRRVITHSNCLFARIENLQPAESGFTQPTTDGLYFNIHGPAQMWDPRRIRRLVTQYVVDRPDLRSLASQNMSYCNPFCLRDDLFSNVGVPADSLEPVPTRNGRELVLAFTGVLPTPTAHQWAAEIITKAASQVMHNNDAPGWNSMPQLNFMRDVGVDLDVVLNDGLEQGGCWAMHTIMDGLARVFVLPTENKSTGHARTYFPTLDLGNPVHNDMLYTSSRADMGGDIDNLVLDNIPIRSYMQPAVTMAACGAAGSSCDALVRTTHAAVATQQLIHPDATIMRRAAFDWCLVQGGYWSCDEVREQANNGQTGDNVWLVRSPVHGGWAFSHDYMMTRGCRCVVGDPSALGCQAATAPTPAPNTRSGFCGNGTPCVCNSATQCQCATGETCLQSDQWLCHPAQAGGSTTPRWVPRAMRLGNAEPLNRGIDPSAQSFATVGSFTILEDRLVWPWIDPDYWTGTYVGHFNNGLWWIGNKPGTTFVPSNPWSLTQMGIIQSNLAARRSMIANGWVDLRMDTVSWYFNEPIRLAAMRNKFKSESIYRNPKGRDDFTVLDRDGNTAFIDWATPWCFSLSGQASQGAQAPRESTPWLFANGNSSLDFSIPLTGADTMQGDLANKSDCLRAGYTALECTDRFLRRCGFRMINNPTTPRIITHTRWTNVRTHVSLNTSGGSLYLNAGALTSASQPATGTIQFDIDLSQRPPTGSSFQLVRVGTHAWRRGFGNYGGCRPYIRMVSPPSGVSCASTSKQWAVETGRHSQQDVTAFDLGDFEYAVNRLDRDAFSTLLCRIDSRTVSSLTFEYGMGLIKEAQSSQALDVSSLCDLAITGDVTRIEGTTVKVAPYPPGMVWPPPDPIRDADDLDRDGILDARDNCNPTRDCPTDFDDCFNPYQENFDALTEQQLSLSPRGDACDKRAGVSPGTVTNRWSSSSPIGSHSFIETLGRSPLVKIQGAIKSGMNYPDRATPSGTRALWLEGCVCATFEADCGSCVGNAVQPNSLKTLSYKAEGQNRTITSGAPNDAARGEDLAFAKTDARPLNYEWSTNTDTGSRVQDGDRVAMLFSHKHRSGGTGTADFQTYRVTSPQTVTVSFTDQVDGFDFKPSMYCYSRVQQVHGSPWWFVTARPEEFCFLHPLTGSPNGQAQGAIFDSATGRSADLGAFPRWVLRPPVGSTISEQPGQGEVWFMTSPQDIHWRGVRVNSSMSASDVLVRVAFGGVDPTGKPTDRLYMTIAGDGDGADGTHLLTPEERWVSETIDLSETQRRLPPGEMGNYSEDSQELDVPPPLASAQGFIDLRHHRVGFVESNPASSSPGRALRVYWLDLRSMTWSGSDPLLNPPDHAGMIGRPKAGEIWLIGGTRPGASVPITAFSDGLRWTEMSGAGALPRRGPNVAYDEYNDRIFAFGGSDTDGRIRADVFVLDLRVPERAWVLVPQLGGSAPTPDPDSQTQLMYDFFHDRLIVMEFRPPSVTPPMVPYLGAFDLKSGTWGPLSATGGAEGSSDGGDQDGETGTGDGSEAVDSGGGTPPGGCGCQALPNDVQALQSDMVHSFAWGGVIATLWMALPLLALLRLSRRSSRWRGVENDQH